MEPTQQEHNGPQSHAAQAASVLPEHAVRAILRKLRDLDLRFRGLQIDGDRSVRLEGCLSPDAPIEDGLAYRLRLCDGSPARLEVNGRRGELEINITGPEGLLSSRRIELIRDAFGRAIAPAIQARMHPDVCDPRKVEHFLRRLVRAAFAAPRAA